jgi:hypothetical protein
MMPKTEVDLTAPDNTRGYVPKWNITLRSGDFEYKRRALAASSLTKSHLVLCILHSPKYGTDISGLPLYVKYVAEHSVKIIERE